MAIFLNESQRKSEPMPPLGVRQGEGKRSKGSGVYLAQDVLVAMKRGFKVAVIVIIFFLVFFFAPFIPMTTANFSGGPDYTALVSPSFALFQCGDFIGHVGIQVPNGATVNPYKPYSSFWNCDYPRPNW